MYTVKTEDLAVHVMECNCMSFHPLQNYVNQTKERKRERERVCIYLNYFVPAVSKQSICYK